MAASRVASGILISRILGLVRERIFASYFGSGPLADAWRAALRIPNVIQNLLGEGSLSASFIPVYVRLLEEGRERDAGRVAGAVLGLLAATAGMLALLGVLAAPWLVELIAPGFGGDQRGETTVRLLRILFPMTGVLVLSAWALGILNSHRRFFVSYVAPGLWNLAMIVVLVALGSRGVVGVELMVALAWGALVGGVLQLLFQLPFAAGVLRHVVPSFRHRIGEVREILRNLVPVVAARGAVNLSGLLDVFLASFLAEGAIALMGYAQTLYLLPISLFGMSIAAAELPELARDRVEGLRLVRDRAQRAVRTVVYWLIPSAVGYMVFREEIVAAIFAGGAFGRDDTAAAGLVLAAYAVGLPASGSSRVLASAFYGLGDTRTPARVAYLRITISAVVGIALMTPLDRLSIGALGLGAVGLASGSAVAAWVEVLLLRRSLSRRLDGIRLVDPGSVRTLLGVALATGVGLVGRFALPEVHPVLAVLGTVLPFGVAYLVATRAMGVAPRWGGAAPSSDA